MLGATIRRLRRERRLTAAQLAGAIGVSDTYISQVERNQTTPSSERITQIANVLQVDPEHLNLLAGRLSEDILEILQQNPTLLDTLRSTQLTR